MRLILDPFRLLLISLTGCLNQVLREQLGNKRLRLNDDQLRRLAAKAKKPGWCVLHELTTIVTPETLLAWRRKLIAEVRIADVASIQRPDGSFIRIGAKGELGDNPARQIVHQQVIPPVGVGAEAGR